MCPLTDRSFYATGLRLSELEVNHHNPTRRKKSGESRMGFKAHLSALRDTLLRYEKEPARMPKLRDGV